MLRQTEISLAPHLPRLSDTSQSMITDQTESQTPYPPPPRALQKHTHTNSSFPNEIRFKLECQNEGETLSMYTLTPTCSTTTQLFKFPASSFTTKNNIIFTKFPFQRRENVGVVASSTVEGSEPKIEEDTPKEETNTSGQFAASAIDKDLKKAVQKTAATFAPRASTASKNPAVPGTTLYTVFEVQAYASMLLGGVLSFNWLFPSNEPDIWRLMGMWSIWMFTIPSLRARDCSKNEKEALNYLFLLVPLLNVIIPFFWKSFAVVWSADTLAFFGMYAWKLGWLQKTK